MNPERGIASKGIVPALLFAGLFPSLMTWIYFVTFSGNPTMRVLYPAGKLVQFGFPVVWVALIQGERVRIGRPSWNGLALGIGFGLAILIAAIGIYFGFFKGSIWFAEFPARLREKLGGMGIATPARFGLFAFFISLIHSGLEEYYWRWFFFGQLRRITRPGAAIPLSAIGFMLHHVIVIACYFRPEHWPLVAIFSVAVAIGGCAWAWLYYRTGSIYASWVSHAMVDIALMIIGYDLAWGLAH